MSIDLSWHQLNSRQVVQVDLLQPLYGSGTQTVDATFNSCSVFLACSRSANHQQLWIWILLATMANKIWIIMVISSSHEQLFCLGGFKISWSIGTTLHAARGNYLIPLKIKRYKISSLGVFGHRCCAWGYLGTLSCFAAERHTNPLSEKTVAHMHPTLLAYIIFILSL